METNNVVDKLLIGDFTFFNGLSSFQVEGLISSLKQMDILTIILDNHFNELSLKYPKYTFYLVYDIEKYKDYCLSYLSKDFDILFSSNFFHHFLGSSKWSIDYVKENMKKIVMTYPDAVFSIVKYGIECQDKELLNLLLYSDDYQVRGRGMYELIDSYPYYFFNYYPNVVDSMIKKDENGNVISIIDEEMASRIACRIANYNLGTIVFDEVKEFIFHNYESNILASLLAGHHEEIGVEPMAHFDLIEADMTRFFLTSKDFKFELYKIGNRYIDPVVYKEFGERIAPFVEIDKQMIEHIFYVGLGDKFLTYVDHYLEKSTGARVVEDLGRGSTARAFKVGDYVIKLSEKKWDFTGYPKLFFFAKGYESDYVRSEFGNVIGAVEVQKYYSRSVSCVEMEIIDKFLEELSEYGYSIGDSVTGLNGTPNLFRLDSYLEAECNNPEELPDWFKANPVVWVDIDLIHKKK